MSNKPLRIKVGRQWRYLYIINGKEDHYPIGDLVKHPDCVVDKQVLAVRLAGFFKGTHTKLTSIHHCMSRPLTPNKSTRNIKSADFDLLNALWR